MLSIKRLFRFDYFSPLDIDICKERMRPDYEVELIKDGTLKTNMIEWFTSASPRKDLVRVETSWGYYTFHYDFTLEEAGGGTILHCKHNPFGIFSLGLHVTFVVPVLIYTLYYILRYADFSGVVPFIYISLILLVIPLVVLESFARRSVDKRLALLEARQVK